MLFNSYAFIFGLLPIVLTGFFLLGRWSRQAAVAWLSVASLVFYGWWNPVFVGLLLGSVIFNYGAAWLIGTGLRGQAGDQSRARSMLVIAVAANLFLLAYFKYANFFIDTLRSALGAHWLVGEILLPIGISFFTFTQIAFLVDSWRGKADEHGFLDYLLFVTYFPYLLSGPIIHHAQLVPQIRRAETYRINPQNLATGLAIFVIGLAKKLLIADTLAGFTNVFDVAGPQVHPAFLESWIGTLAYTFQLYFDFSGYSDMAIGVSLLFNLRLPLNFASPYKATSVIDFWRRWHMTLSAFLRDYLYFPLGGNRKGTLRRYTNLMITMLLGGLWHGAGWSFVIWGGLHGIYLTLNHAWRGWIPGTRWQRHFLGSKIAGGALTFGAVAVAWVFFRSANLTTAFAMLTGMLGLNGVSLPASLQPAFAGFPNALQHFKVTFDGLMPVTTGDPLFILENLALAGFLIWGCPNVHELFKNYPPTCDEAPATGTATRPGFLNRILSWKPTPIWGVLHGILFLILLAQIGSRHATGFLYFQF